MSMNDFICKYFMLGDTCRNAFYVTFWLVLVFYASAGAVAGIAVSSVNQSDKLKTYAVIGAVLGVAFGCSLTWAFVGESTSWSAPIGQWLRQ